MGAPSEVILEDNLVFTITSRTLATGALTDADAPPDYRVYEDETGAAILTGSMAKLDDANTLGFYSALIACTAANGFEDGKSYSIYIESVVAGVTEGITFGFKARTHEWDEVLTGATHNIATSSGRRLRGIQEFQGYAGGAIWIDTANGTAGTTDFENGTVENPVDTIADANTLAASLNINRFRVAPGSTITFAASQDDQEFEGNGWTLALGGQSISDSHIVGADVSGIATGATAPHFRECHMGACTLPPALLTDCGLANEITAGSVGTFILDGCYSEVAGTSAPGWDFGAAVGSVNLNIRHYSGGIEIANMGSAGTDTMSLEGFGQLIIAATCSAGTVAIRGNFTVTDNAGAVLTLSDDARIDVAQINGEVVDALNIDTYAEPGQGTPPAMATLVQKIGFLFKSMRNKLTSDADGVELYDDAGTTVDQKQAHADDGTTFSRSEMITGP